uniref:Trace amine associated receptor 1 n=1 Tax=Kryptolebias marmoratus TaxID=37003 RepID=A0A3Q3BP08_KRYMA
MANPNSQIPGLFRQIRANNFLQDLCHFIPSPGTASICILLYIFLGLLSVMTVCGNVLVIISITYFKQLHTPSNYLIISLAVADLLVGIVVFPMSMSFPLSSCLYYRDIFCKIRDSFDVILSSTSILNLCCISVDRYYAVCKPLIYRTKINVHVVGIMILMSWGVPVLVAIGFVIAELNQEKCKENCFYDCEGSCLIDALISTTLACIFSFYIPVIIMLSIYLKIFLVAQSQVKTIHNATCQSKRSVAAVSKMERKATKTLAVVMGVFLLCWSPYFLCIIFQPLTYDATPIAAIETLNWLTLSNSMLNPFIYAFFYSWFRSAVRLMLSGKIFRDTEEVKSKLIA